NQVEKPKPEGEKLGEGGRFPVKVTAELLMRTLPGSLQQIEGYQYNAPLLVNSRTVIREYEVPRPNNIREGVTLTDSRSIWLADEGSNRVIRVDTVTGAVQNFEVPSEDAVGPHSLYVGADNSLWVSGLFHGIIANLDPTTEKWRVWRIPKSNDGT